ncbi:MAG: RluA family pseudouridine synthase [Candidatus Doudnabacteria bacterium]|nr:RluA family pseudouridine synthase [Candidatus Doudnabacteria bacterium]
MEAKVIRFTVQKNARLDIALAHKVKAQLSRAEVQRAIAGGQVRVNKQVVRKKSFVVPAGAEVTLHYQPPRFAIRHDVPVKVMHEDENFLVVDKPAGVVVHTNPRQDKTSIAAVVAGLQPAVLQVGDSFRPGIVHRLDADTSGLLLIAKNKKSYEYFKQLFKNRQIEKWYTALVHRRLTSAHGVFSEPIGRKPGQKKFSVGLGRAAKTEYWVEAYYKFAAYPALDLDHPGSSKRGRAERSEVPYRPPWRTGAGVDPAPDEDRRVVSSGGQSPGTIDIQTGTIIPDNFYSSKRPGNPRRGDGVDTFTLAKIQLHTGRTHQVRVHFAHAGFPLAGDRLYGGEYRRADRDLFPRQFLHATRLKFLDLAGRQREFVSPLAKELQDILNKGTTVF